MKTFGTTKIIGVDHGYGNMKTANHCFPTGIDAYDSEPLFTRDMLVYDGRYYLIGEGHKEFVGEKSQDDDFYLLTLAAVAMELHDEGLTEADVFLAAGLPLTWTANQKEAFAAYLSRNEEVQFVWKKVAYHIRIVGVRIYPQGFAAIAEKAAAMCCASAVWAAPGFRQTEPDVFFCHSTSGQTPLHLPSVLQPSNLSHTFLLNLFLMEIVNFKT